MKFSSNVITFLSIAVTAVAGVQTGGEDEVDCVGEIIDTSTITSLDFLNSVVTKNELHLEGGELRYSDIGFVRDRPVDLVVTVVDGEYTDIAEVWADRGKLPDVQNGKKEDSQFANINLQTVKKKPLSGLGNFQFCFHDTQTNALTTVDTFRWSVYDLDERSANKKSIKERMFMDLSQAQSMQMWPTVEDSEIELGCEDGSVSLPCDAGIRTVFHSSTDGVGGDNPTDPNAMTDLQKKRSITFTFTDTDCWVFSYDHYCPGEQEDAERSYYCKSYTGGNFLFSGDSQEIHQDGECVVPPSPPPTDPPTNPPTTGTPTDEPTAAPTTSAPSSTPSIGATTSAPSPGASDLCEGKTQAETNLDFFQAEVTENTLHQPGGKLIYDNVGIVRDKPVNLVVTVAEGTTYTTSKPDMNGKTGGSMFGNINLMTKENDVQSGTGTFNFCFHDKTSNELVTVDSFLWSVYDIDERSAGKKGIKEKLIMDTSQIEEYALWPNEDESEIKLFCENFTLWPYTSASQVNQLPCNDGERTVFHSSTQGVGADNPKDKDNMTEQQRRRSVQFFFKNKSCFTFTYSHYCPSDEAGSSKKCVWYGGGNMLFAGSAKQLIEEGECITQSPTQSPTDAPTVESSVSPTTASSGTPTTSTPTDAPTAAPTTSAPTDVPTAAPTTSAPTTSAPTDAPTAAPTTSAPTTLSPTIKAVTRPPIITNGGDDDDDDLVFQPTCPADVKLIATHGSKDIDLERVVRIVSQDTSTVQVALNQGWEHEVSGGNANAIPTIDHIFYSYRTNIFDENCYEETSVMENKRIDTVTIQCNVNKPFALLKICVVDDITNGLLSVQDDATIPKCCHPTFPPNTPTVCYTIAVNCVTECEDDDAMDGIDTTNNGIVSRGLRGGSSYLKK